MLAKELMTQPVITVRPDVTVKDAIKRLDKHNITAMPVVDERDQLVGIISEADLLHDTVVDDPRAHMRPTEERDEPTSTVVAQVMTLHVVSVHEGTDASDIARLMLETGVKSIPVVEDQMVVGMVSRRDLIRALATTDNRIRDEIAILLSETGLTGWAVTVDDGAVSLFGAGEPRDLRLAVTLARTARGVTSVTVAPAATTEG